MRLLTFIKEKWVYIVSQGLVFIFIAFLFSALDVNQFATLFLFVLMTVAITIALVSEWLSKNRYYRSTSDMISDLKEKHLISAMLREPDFEEGSIWYEWFIEASKSMNDIIGEMKREQVDYREYVEAWVHEIKIPITVIHLICDNEPSEANRSLLEEVHKVEGYIDQALYYARTTTLEKDYVIKKMVLSDVVNEVIKKNAKVLIAMKATIQMKSLDFEVNSDTKWVIFIIGQMVSNSIKYSSGPLALSISAVEHPSAIELNISDNGVGIPESDLPRIFDKGFSGENGRKFAKSTGMGLYLCQKMCEKMYIGLYVTSALGEGTTFSMVFPKDRSKLFER